MLVGVVTAEVPWGFVVLQLKLVLQVLLPVAIVQPVAVKVPDITGAAQLLSFQLVPLGQDTTTLRLLVSVKPAESLAPIIQVRVPGEDQLVLYDPSAEEGDPVALQLFKHVELPESQKCHPVRLVS